MWPSVIKMMHILYFAHFEEPLKWWINHSPFFIPVRLSLCLSGMRACDVQQQKQIGFHLGRKNVRFFYLNTSLKKNHELLFFSAVILSPVIEAMGSKFFYMLCSGFVKLSFSVG